MPCIAYDTSYKPDANGRDVIAHTNRICAEQIAAGYNLTLRQIYYQFVAHDLFPDSRKWVWTGSKWQKSDQGTKNAQPNYKWLGDIIMKGRLAGLIDWNYLEDRTRSLTGNPHWQNPDAIIRSAAYSFALDKWRTQEQRIEIWVEKDALINIVERVARQRDVDCFSCRGYTSASELWNAARRIMRYIEGGQAVTILHFGDHDPSGIDMTRDIRDRLELFTDRDWLNAHVNEFDGDKIDLDEIRDSMRRHLDGLDALTIKRVALNYDQVQQYNPPPNPTKLTDSRSGPYLAEHGGESWELDALSPAVLSGLMNDEIDAIVDPDAFLIEQRAEERHRRIVTEASDRWEEVAEFLAGSRS